jgi:hypothetical protein
MSSWEVGTWLAIGVLVVVPPFIFAWFVVDAVKWWRRHPRRRARSVRGPGTEYGPD